MPQNIPNSKIFQMNPTRVIIEITPNIFEIGLYLWAGTCGFVYPQAKPKKINKKK
tara:strand:- start:95 stop:259 length:165 start_codon:yes stop_codon:yes gene_type:complete